MGKLVNTKPAAFRPLLGTSVFENLNDEIRTERDYICTKSPERSDLVAQTELPMHSYSLIVQNKALVVIEFDASLKGWRGNCKGM